jgi:aspartyl-tRNA synthetase
MIRTHEAGTLRTSDAGETVVLAGWVARRRDHGGVVFIDLRDASGVAQVVWRGEDATAEQDAGHGLRAEFCVRVRGTVQTRPAGNENPELPTGAIEVVADDLEVLSEADPLPFPIEGNAALSEEVRLKYRYLDIRREQMARSLRIRSQATYLVSDVMRDHRFVNVETPDLTRSTPEGARDFLVPVRLRPGHWYALPQSPQLFKQLLMVGGLERYYQLARCFRDEDFRADRQPEFTQVDLEMSFVTREDVIAVAEDVLHRLWSEIAGYDLPLPLPRLTYADAMARYGSDKPDLRFGLELADLTDYFAETGFRVFQAPYVGAVVMPGGASQTRRELDGWQEWARARGARGLAYVLVTPDGALSGPVVKNLSEKEQAGLLAATGASPGDAIFFAAGPSSSSRELLGAARLEIGHRCGLIDPTAWAFTWVVDAPMFEEDGRGGWTPVHHPFTAPLPEWADKFTAEPGRGPRRRLRHRVQRDRDRRRVHPDPPAGHAAAGVRRDRPVPRAGPVAVRLPAGRAAVRAAAARRDRVRLGPDADAAHRPRLDPRRDRLPQGRVRPRPADRRADPHHPRAAQGSRPRRSPRRPATPRFPEAPGSWSLARPVMFSLIGAGFPQHVPKGDADHGRARPGPGRL